jgi:hypothetical protein
VPILSSIEANPSSRLAALSLPSRNATCSVSSSFVCCPSGMISTVVNETEIGVPRLVIE